MQEGTSTKSFMDASGQTVTTQSAYVADTIKSDIINGTKYQDLSATTMYATTGGRAYFANILKVDKNYFCIMMFSYSEMVFELFGYTAGTHNYKRIY